MDELLAYFLKCCGILFIAIGPLDNAAVFAGLTIHYSKQEKREMALRSCMVAGVILVLFPLVGDMVLKFIEIPFYALEVAGGILLMIPSLKMAIGEYEDWESVADKHGRNRDLSVFPMAMPLLAGPAGITQSMLLIGKVRDDFMMQVAVIFAIVCTLLLAYVLFRLASQVSRLLGEKGAEILTRVLGVLLAALAVNFVINGLKDSGLFSMI